jgi:cyclopropane-fatty-acyl-phospholipid synthase
MSTYPSEPLNWLLTAPAAPTQPSSLKGVPFVARIVLNILGRMKVGALGVILPDGRRLAYRGTAPGPHGIVVLKSYNALKRVASAGSLGFGEAYLDGEWDSPDVTAVLACALANGEHVAGFYSSSGLSRLFDRMRHFLRANTKAGSRRNIQAHYDLGNAFYEKFLDETMTYSSALFANGATDLTAAQTAKYASLADMMDLKPGQHVLEIGCGWGGFAEYAAAQRGARVTALTISREQLAYAQARMQRQGLSDKVEIRFQDYRDVAGQFDKVASIEMFEAVGERYWPTYFGKIRDVLKPGGAAALQVITIDDAYFEAYRSKVDFIQKYVFPGGMLPSMTALKKQAERATLQWGGHFDFRHDYARTLAIWHERFLARWDEIAALGFDDRFKRLWTYYLSYCEAGFGGEAIGVVQLKLTTP